MTDMNTSISKTGLTYLYDCIGNKCEAIIHESFNAKIPGVYQRVGFLINSQYYYLDNPVKWFDNYFAQPDYIPCLEFNKAGSIQQITQVMDSKKLIIDNIEDNIEDIFIMQDTLDITKKHYHHQHWESTEGIIIKTTVREYAFYKANTWLNETLLLYRGHNVLSKSEPIETHWAIFGQPFSANIHRNIISLKTKLTLYKFQCEIHGSD